MLQYRALLNHLFKIPETPWQLDRMQSELCEISLLNQYQQDFPELWEFHDLILPVTQSFREPLQETPMSTIAYVLRLFVSRRHSSTESSLRNLHRALERSMLQPYTLQVIDISMHPEQVELDQVTATPTLLRVYPLPHRRLVGNLENEDQLLHLLAEMDLNAYH